MTSTEWVEHLRICAKSSIVEMAPAQAGELAEVLDRALQAAPDSKAVPMVCKACGVEYGAPAEASKSCLHRFFVPRAAP